MTFRVAAISSLDGAVLVSESSSVWIAASSSSTLCPGRAVATIWKTEVSWADCWKAATSWAIFFSYTRLL